MRVLFKQYKNRKESFVASLDFFRSRTENRFQVGDDVLDGGLAIWVKEVQDNYDCELNVGGSTLRMKAMTERVKTKEEVPEDPLC